MEYSEAEKQMLREVLPGIATQLRGALANIHGALGRLAPERLRDRDTGTDRSAAILCQSYYKILRVVNNLSDAPMLAEDKPLGTENVELVELLEGLCRQGQVLAELLDLNLSFTCRDRAHVAAANRRDHRGIPADGAGLRAAVREGQRPRHSSGQAGASV